MATINPEFANLPAAYLFSEIARRTREFQSQNPGVEVMRLGIGNTTEPLTPKTLQGLRLVVEKLASVETYTGYGDEQGDARLRQALAEWYQQKGLRVQPQEVFISDGAKTDSANVSSIFDRDNIIAVQDPVYPVYVDSNVIAGRVGKLQDGIYDNLVYMRGTEENGFVSPPPQTKADLIFLCYPNNPTGAVATKDQLQAFVNYARTHRSVIVFDAAYSAYVSDPNLPRSIYEIESARECAIEINSFSKWAGFTGVRLGWTVVPMDLVVEDTAPEQLNAAWNRRQTTMFNGASNIAQEGGLAVLTEEGQKECQGLVNYYMESTHIIRQTLEDLRIRTFGGINAPYVWMRTPNGLNSWEFFDKLLSEAHVVGTPGVGFGPGGEGYFRLAGFGHRENILRATESIRQNLKI